MDLNRFGLDTMTAGIESFEPSPDLDMGVESKHEDQIVEEVHALVEANESLDRLLHTGLTDGLESVSETLKIIQLSDTIHTMNAIADGTESYDSDMSGLESALQYAGIDVASITGYTAGTEAREGGLVQPFRSAGTSIKDSKAYKAVSDSWVGKAGAGVVKRIKSIWQWIVDHIFGKTKPNSNKIIQEAIEAAGGDISGAMNAMADVQAKMKEEIERYSSGYVKEMDRANQNVFSLSLVRQQLDQAKKELETMKADLEALTKTNDNLSTELQNEKTRSSALRYDKEALKSENAALQNENANLKAERNQLSKESDALNNALADKSKAYATTVARVKCLEATLKTTFNNIVAKVEGLSQQAKKEVLDIVRKDAEVEKLYLAVASTMAKIKGTVKRKIKAGKRIGKYKRGNESFDFDFNDLIGFTAGSESTIEEILDTTFDDGNESYIPTEFIVAISAYDMIGAIDAGIECMNIDIFGHPYTGIDMNTQQVIAFTDRHDFGEAGTEAEETKKEEKPSETAKSEDAKKPGFFENMGTKAKKAGKWVRSKGRQFWKWIKSKISILEPIMDRLAMMTSKSFDLSALNESELGTSLATIDSNLEKVAKLLDKEHKESAKSAEDYTKIIAESKKKISYAKTVAPIRMIGASDLLKKIKKISKLVNKATEGKVENAAEMTAIMSETTKAIANFNMEIRRALNAAKKVAATTKDIPEQSESKSILDENKLTYR